MVTIRDERAPKMPFLGQPGRCPVCGGAARLRDEEVFPIGCWDGPHGGGTVFGANCPGWGVILMLYSSGHWIKGNSEAVAWHSNGDRHLVGGDRWRGRPGAWAPADAPRHEARLKALREQVGSLEEAVRILHASSGLGALPIAGLVARLSGVSERGARRFVVGALAPSVDESHVAPSR